MKREHRLYADEPEETPIVKDGEVDSNNDNEETGVPDTVNPDPR